MYEPSAFQEKKELFLVSYQEFSKVIGNCDNCQKKVECIVESQGTGVVVAQSISSERDNNKPMFRDQGIQTDLTCFSCSFVNVNSRNDMIFLRDNSLGYHNKRARSVSSAPTTVVMSPSPETIKQMENLNMITSNSNDIVNNDNSNNNEMGINIEWSNGNKQELMANFQIKDDNLLLNSCNSENMNENENNVNIEVKNNDECEVLSVGTEVISITNTLMTSNTFDTPMTPIDSTIKRKNDEIATKPRIIMKTAKNKNEKNNNDNSKDNNGNEFDGSKAMPSNAKKDPRTTNTNHKRKLNEMYENDGNNDNENDNNNDFDINNTWDEERKDNESPLRKKRKVSSMKNENDNNNNNNNNNSNSNNGKRELSNESIESVGYGLSGTNSRPHKPKKYRNIRNEMSNKKSSKSNKSNKLNKRKKVSPSKKCKIPFVTTNGIPVYNVNDDLDGYRNNSQNENENENENEKENGNNSMKYFDFIDNMRIRNNCNDDIDDNNDQSLSQISNFSHTVKAIQFENKLENENNISPIKNKNQNGHYCEMAVLSQIMNEVSTQASNNNVNNINNNNNNNENLNRNNDSIKNNTIDTNNNSHITSPSATPNEMKKEKENKNGKRKFKSALKRENTILKKRFKLSMSEVKRQHKTKDEKKRKLKTTKEKEKENENENGNKNILSMNRNNDNNDHNDNNNNLAENDSDCEKEFECDRATAEASKSISLNLANSQSFVTKQIIQASMIAAKNNLQMNNNDNNNNGLFGNEINHNVNNTNSMNSSNKNDKTNELNDSHNSLFNDTNFSENNELIDHSLLQQTKKFKGDNSQASLKSQSESDDKIDITKLTYNKRYHSKYSVFAFPESET